MANTFWQLILPFQWVGVSLHVLYGSRDTTPFQLAVLLLAMHACNGLPPKYGAHRLCLFASDTAPAVLVLSKVSPAEFGICICHRYLLVDVVEKPRC